MLLSTLGSGRPGADADDGNNDGTDPDESNAGGNGDTNADNGKKIFLVHSVLTVLFLYLLQTYNTQLFI